MRPFETSNKLRKQSGRIPTPDTGFEPITPATPSTYKLLTDVLMSHQEAQDGPTGRPRTLQLPHQPFTNALAAPAPPPEFVETLQKALAEGQSPPANAHPLSPASHRRQARADVR